MFSSLGDASISNFRAMSPISLPARRIFGTVKDIPGMSHEQFHPAGPDRFWPMR
jgi:hypothetical protein